MFNRHKLIMYMSMRGLTNAELARKVGVNVTYISSVRTGKKEPSALLVKALELVLGTGEGGLLNEFVKEDVENANA